MDDFSWVETGFDTPADPRPPRSDNETWRFFLKQGESKNVVLLSGPNEFYKVRQHEVYDEGTKIPKYLTCCQSDTVNCPLCEAAKNNKKLARWEFWVGTVLDLDGYEKDGKKVGVGKRKLFPIKARTKAILQDVFTTCLEEGWPIKNGKFKISRSKDERSARVGDVFQAVGTFDFEKWLKKAKEQGLEIVSEPFNIPQMEEFKPNYELCAKFAGVDLGSNSPKGNTQDFTVQLEDPF